MSGDRLQGAIVNLMWIHQNIALGPTIQRWKDAGVFAFERLGGTHLLVALNKDKQSGRTIHVDTGFPPGTLLHDYTGHVGDVRSGANGSVTLNLPRNADGLGYVCYSLMGISGGFATVPSGTLQVFEGVEDLDLRPAESGVAVQIFRVWVEAGTQVSAGLTFDTIGWGTCTPEKLRSL